MAVVPDDARTRSVRRRATDDLLARIDKDQVKQNIFRDAFDAGLLTGDEAHDAQTLENLFDTADYWVNPSAYSGRQ